MDAGVKQLKVIGRGEMVVGSEFQYREVIGINDLTKALVRFVSKGCWAIENRVFVIKKVLRGIIDFSSSEQTPWKYL